jgi:hypothetical protein
MERDMKKLALAAAFAAVSSQAFAGGLAAVVVEPEVIVEQPMASSGSNLIVPLVLIALIALASSGSSD